MTYAYIDGQEAASLFYYERLLRETTDGLERNKIEAVIEQLRRKLSEAGGKGRTEAFHGSGLLAYQA